MHRINMIGMALIAILGCGRTTSPKLIQSLPTMTPAVAETELRKRDSIVFQSWAGLHQGFDADTHLKLFRDGRAEITYSGYDIERVSGTWAVSDGAIRLDAPMGNLSQMPGSNDWPPLELRRGDGRLYLFPARDTTALSYSDDSAWPLREIEVAQ